MNNYDSSLYENFLIYNGYKSVNNEESADIIIINTCAVREKSVDKALSLIGKIIKLKKERPSITIGVIGCANNLIKKKLKNLKSIDFIFGPLDDKNLPIEFTNFINNISKEKDQEKDINDNLSSFIPIIFGCNSFCSYCIVPLVRGGERSRKPIQIINEANICIKKGVKEIILLGQNVNNYCYDLSEDYNFSKLLNNIANLNDIKRVGFMTSHPKNFDLEILDIIKENKKIYRHFHLPIQSGDDKILSAMKRGYTVNQYSDLISRIRDYFPLSLITTDIIVGFPGEDEISFQNTLSTIKKIGFDNIYAVAYSIRPGTKAALLKNQISLKEKKKRLNYLLELQKSISKEKIKRFIGTKSELFVTEVKIDKVFGKNQEEKLVEIDFSENVNPGDLVNIEIIDIKVNNLIGRMI